MDATTARERHRVIALRSAAVCKARDPEAWNLKKSTYWTERYRNNADFRARCVQSARDYRARKKALKKEAKSIGGDSASNFDDKETVA